MVLFNAISALTSASMAAFVDVTQSVGISYEHADADSIPTNDELGIDRATFTPASNHAGAAAVDVDGDGWTDFLGARYGLPPLLYMNQGDGSFLEDSVARGLDVAVDAAAFAAGDFDNDGDQDLFMAPHRGPRYFLFINDGSGHYSEEAIARGVALDAVASPHEGYSISLVDYDLDGFLDIYVSEWGPGDPDEHHLHSVLLRNRGKEAPASFENVTQEAGLVQPLAGIEQQHGFSSAWADFDGDGWPDLALIADFGSSRLYWNNGNGTFTEGTDAAGVGLDEFGMGVAVADYDNDGDLDFYVTSIFDQELFDANGSNTGNKLYQNLGNRKFAEVASVARIDRAGWTWGAAFFEFDNDGDSDLVVTNGMDTAMWDAFLYEDALDDPTILFRNDGDGKFSRFTSEVGIKDTGLGKAIVVLDYNKDGAEDLVITNSFGKPIVYESTAITNGNEWLRIKLVGNASNRDGVGAVARTTDAGQTQTALFNPTNSYIGQREGILHFGVGIAGGTVDEVEIRWPSGIKQVVENVTTNQLHVIEEPDLELVPPIIVEPPASLTVAYGADVELSVVALSDSGASYAWEKDGVSVRGAVGPTLKIDHAQPYDAGEYRVRVANAVGESTSQAATVALEIALEDHSVARWWNEFALGAIRKEFPAPTIHGRNLYHVSAAMWDAFWSYELDGWNRASPVFLAEKLTVADWGSDREAAQREAISYAAYRVLNYRYRNSINSERTLYNLRWLMDRLGYDPAIESVVGNAPASVGNRIGSFILAATSEDGSNEAEGYADASDYQSVNPPMVFKLPGVEMIDPNRWQPLAFDFRVSQNGIPLEEKIQEFVGVNWREVECFAIQKDSGITIAWDPGPPPLFGAESHRDYVQAAVEVIRYSSYLDPSQSEMIDISPGAHLNNPLGTNDGKGREINPYTGEAYTANLVKLADYGRVLAEFWADGPASETPPGHWNALFNAVTDDPLCERRYLGHGEALSELEWSVQGYLALNGAMHDAAVAAWTLKRQYDYARPISMIRYLASLGQSSDPSEPGYHSQGLPVIEGLIEVVTVESSSPGERHEHLAASQGKIAIRAWAGEPADPETQVGGVKWILGESWIPYQRRTFVTPAFAGYVSGHSAFSRAGAEVMTLLTGSPYFPGGIGRFRFAKDEFLEFELGPSADVVLEWATYFDAADQAGVSRLYGGIHVEADDFVGRFLGARIGVESFLKAHALRNGGDRRNALANAQISYQIPLTDNKRFLSFQFEDGKGLDFRTVQSIANSSETVNEGLYFEFGDDDAGELSANATVLARSDQLLRAKADSRIDESEGASVAFSIPDGDPRLLSLRARPYDAIAADGSSINSDPRILVYRLAGGQETLVAQNDDRVLGDSDSIIQVLALRDGLESGEIDSIDAALALALPPGEYRVEMLGLPEGGVATLEIAEVK